MELPEKTLKNSGFKKPLSSKVFKFVYAMHIMFLVFASIINLIEESHGYKGTPPVYGAIPVGLGIAIIWFIFFIPVAFGALLLSFLYDLISKRTEPAVKFILIKSALLSVIIIIAVLIAPLLIRAELNIFGKLFQLTGDLSHFSIDSLILAALPLIVVVYYSIKMSHLDITRATTIRSVPFVIKPKTAFRIFYVILIAILILAYWRVLSSW